MQTTLIISQTIFYLVASLAIIIVAVGTGVIVFHIVKIAKDLRKISQDIKETSDAISERIVDSIDRLSEIPFISFLFKKSRKIIKK